MAAPLRQTFVPHFLPYRAMLRNEFTLHGRLLHIDFIGDETVLFHAVIPNSRLQDPIAIKSGPESEEAEVVGVLNPNSDLSLFRLLKDETEVLLVQFRGRERKGYPKQIGLTWTPLGEGEQRFQSQMPVKQGNGEWGLDFEGRSAYPSRINSVITEIASGETAFFVRVVDGVEIDCDATAAMPPILLFATILSLKICPF
jgi:hypothetical protein